MKTDFVANVSHELKTPLTSIKGFIETLEDGALEDRENARKFILIIKKHTQALINIVNRYDLDDPEVLTDIYSIARFTLLRLLEVIYRVTTPNGRLFLLRDVFEDVILPFGNSYDLGENFTITAVLYNYRTVMLLEAEDVNGEISFSIKEVSISYEKLYKVLKDIKETFKKATDITDHTLQANAV